MLELEGLHPQQFVQDPAGNLIEERRGKGGALVTRYAYDGDNRLIRAENHQGVSRYQYDPLGRRIAKQTFQGETRFVYDGARLLTEIRGEQQRTYVFEPGGFRPLACSDRLQGHGDAAVYYYHLDHLGTPRELTDAQGQIVWSGQYRAYGSRALADIAEVDNPLRFQGQYFDTETGLHYNLNRYYDPSLGRFISQDPIGLAGGQNLFQYAPNPVNWVDPFGLTCKEYEFDMVQNPGSLAEMRGTPAANFASGKYNTRVLDEDTVFYRGGNGGGGQNSLGQWFNTSPPESVANVRIDNAVKEQWIDPNTLALTGKSPVNAVYGVKVPKGTTVYEGPVGYQGGIYLGGQDKMQTFIPTPWAIQGVEVVSEAPLK